MVQYTGRVGWNRSKVTIFFLGRMMLPDAPTRELFSQHVPSDVEILLVVTGSFTGVLETQLVVPSIFFFLILHFVFKHGAKK